MGRGGGGGVGEGVLIRGSTVWAPPLMFFLRFSENFKNSCVKEQLYVHIVGTLEETDGLLKYLLKSALSLVIHKISKFKTFLLLLRCPIWSFDTKNIQNCIIVIFHLMHLTKPSGYNVSSHLPFHNWCKTITVFISCFQESYKDVCVCMCVWERQTGFTYAGNNLYHR